MVKTRGSTSRIANTNPKLERHLAFIRRRVHEGDTLEEIARQHREGVELEEKVFEETDEELHIEEEMRSGPRTIEEHKTPIWS
ncbi:hypothetical protein vseg_003536 [Gypsophila vaccaria]